MKKIECVECAMTFTGRSDKKFCSDQCRSAFNNRMNSDSTSVMRNVNNILRKNRRILANSLLKDKDKISREKLNQLGFNFKYSTHSFTSKKGKQYTFWYDYGIMQMDNGGFFIVHNEGD